MQLFDRQHTIDAKSRGTSAQETDQQSATASRQVALLERAASGDAAAVRLLVEALTPVVQACAARSLARGTGHSYSLLREQVEDTTQDVLLKLLAPPHHKLRAWRPERGLSLAGYARLITRNEVVDQLRSRRRNPFFDMPTEPYRMDAAQDDSRDPQRLAQHRQTLRRVCQAVQRLLSPLGYEMFCRLWIDSQSVNEICEATGHTRDSVYQWQRRIRMLLARMPELEAGTQ